MQNYKKIQKNEFNQYVGVDLENPDNCKAVFDDLKNNHLELRVLSSQRLKPIDTAQLWGCVQAEPDLSCWTYLPYCLW